MYGRSARYYDALHGFNDYQAGAGAVHQVIQRARPGARRLLDVGCGTGRHLEILRQWYEVAGVDISPELLAVARERLAGVKLYRQDMRALDTGEQYDVITCLFGAVAYVRTPANLDGTIRRFREHLQPGGLLILEPYYEPDRYWTDRVTMDVADQPELKVVRMYASIPPVDRVAILDIHHLVGTPGGVESFVERHELGLFGPDDYAKAFAGAGLAIERYQGNLFGLGAYLGSVQAPLAPDAGP